MNIIVLSILLAAFTESTDTVLQNKTSIAVQLVPKKELPKENVNQQEPSVSEVKVQKIKSNILKSLKDYNNIVPKEEIAGHCYNLGFFQFNVDGFDVQIMGNGLVDVYFST